MKTMNLSSDNNIFSTFAITNEEMLNVRGGENDPIVKPAIPPIVI